MVPVLCSVTPGVSTAAHIAPQTGIVRTAHTSIAWQLVLDLIPMAMEMELILQDADHCNIIY